MATQKLTELPNILYNGIDYENTISEMRSIIENNPNWKENWTSFYNSEAGTMLTQLMAWTSENLGVKQNLVYNEMFIGTAQKDENKIRHLQHIGYMPTMAKSAKGKIVIETSTISESDIILTAKRETSENIAERPVKIFSFIGKDINGDNINFEALQYKDDKPDYMSELSLPYGNARITADTNGNGIFVKEGKTVYEEFSSTTSDGPVFELANANIDDGSIRVYDIDDNNIEFNKVSSFISIEAKADEAQVPYVVEYTTNKTYRIRFASTGVMTYSGEVNYSKLFPAGHKIGVLYRTTKGSVGNSPIGFLKTVTTAKDKNGNTVKITINNEEACTGGSDAETLEDAVLNAPLSLRSMDRAVTPDDFDYLLNKNTNILKIKTYSPSNQPSGFKNYFGRNINPQEAFSFVALKKNYEGVPTSEYKNFPWITLNKENVLNEKYCFDGGVFNEPTEYSKMYNKYKVTLANGMSVNYENARVIKMSDEFCSQVKSEDVNGIMLKLSIDENEEEFFVNIPSSLEYDEGDSGYHSSIMVIDDPYIENYIVRKIAEKSAEYISSAKFEENYVFNCTNKSIKIYMDDKTGVTIPLYEEWNKECLRLLNNIATSKEGTSDLTKALNNDGIIQTINKKFALFYTSQKEFAMYDKNHSLQYLGLNKGNEKVANNFDGTSDMTLKLNGNIYNISVQNISQISYLIYPDSKYARNDRYYVNKQYVSDYEHHLINGYDIGGALYDDDYNVEWYMYVKKEQDFETYEQNSLDDFAYKLTYVFAYADNTNQYIKKLDKDDNFKVVDLDDDDILTLRSTRVSVTSRYNFDENESGYAVFGYDLAFETLNDSYIKNTPDNKINIENVPDVISPYTSLFSFFSETGTTSQNQRIITSIPAAQPAADYSKIAYTKTDDEGMSRLVIKSPLKGESSSLYFQNVENDILSTDFNYAYVRSTSDKAIGLRILDLYISDSSSASYEANITSEDYPLAGYLVLQDNTIDSSSRYETIYANYKLSSIDTLELGSVYENYYLTGDETIDSVNKPKIVGLEGQYMQEYDDDGITRYELIESKSDFDVRFTRKQVETNSLYSIETDMDIVKADLIVLPTAQIIKEEGLNTPVPAHLNFSIDDHPIMSINLAAKFNSVEEISADGLYELIFKAITNTGGESINLNLTEDDVDIKENIYNVINKAYKYKNQLEFGNFTKNSNSKIKFYTDYSDVSTDEIALYKKIFGTKYSNQELFSLYETELEDYMTSDGGFCPKVDNPVVFTYKKKVDTDDGVEIRGPDYYIEVTSYKNSAGNFEYKFGVKKTPNSKFPDTPFYIHFINDRSCLLDDNGNKTEYDEDVLQQYMKNYKISGTDIYFLKPYFRTYDIAATIHYNTNFNLSDIKEEINTKIDEAFGLNAADISKTVSKSKIIKTIMNCAGVESVNITYFGYDFTDKENYPNETYQIDADFYEILFLHEDDLGKHGKVFNYVQFGD